MNNIPYILLVDDDEVSAALMTEAMRELPVEVRVAGDAEMALRMIEAAEPLLIVVDSQLPGMSGSELVQAIRSREGAAVRCPILGLSGFSRGVACNAGFEAAVTAYYEKTDSVETMASIVRRHLPRLVEASPA